MFHESRLRLTLIYSVIIGVTLVMMVAVFYFLLARTLNENKNSSLKMASSKAIEQLDKNIVDLQIQSGERFTLLAQLNEIFLSANIFAIITSTDGVPIFVYSDTARMPNVMYQWMEQDIAQWKTQAGNGNHSYSLSKPFSHFSTEGNKYKTTVMGIGDGFEYLYLGIETTDDVRVLRQMRTLLIILGAVLLLLASLIGHFLAGKTMVPIKNAFNRLRDFTADASHELRTPLTVLNSSVEIVQEHIDLLPPFHQQVLHSAKEEIWRMTVLVDGLLTLARSDSGAVELLREPINLVRILRESVDTLNGAAASKEIAVQVNVNASADEVHLIGDRERIKQLIIIFLDNAIKYNKPGGFVSLSVDTDQAGVVLIVKDSGIGISEKDLPYIFERFYRADKSRSRDLGGTGLGLAIADWIVNAHHGSLTAESEWGQGSTFTVRLPTGA
jgi:signal transduction histidine kinase